MAAISDLATASSVAGTDYLVVSQSGTDRKAAASLFAQASNSTWTPTLAFGGNSVGITYSARAGTWKRAGDLIVANFSFVLTSKGSSTGAATISGLPVSMTGSVCWRYATGLASGVNGLISYVSNTQTLTLLKFASGAVSGLFDTDFTNTTYIEGQIVAYA